MLFFGGPMYFSLLGVDDVKLSSPDDKISEWNCVGYVLVLVTGNNGAVPRRLFIRWDMNKMVY